MASVKIKGENGGALTLSKASTGIGERFTFYIGPRRVVLDERNATQLAAYLANMLEGRFIDRSDKEQKTVFSRSTAEPKKTFCGAHIPGHNAGTCSLPPSHPGQQCRDE